METETKKKVGMYSDVNMSLFPFLDEKNGRRPNQRLCDFTEMRTTGIVMIEATEKKSGVTTTENFRTFTDPNTGTTYGIPTSYDEKTGYFMFKRITPTDSRTYDLSNPEDAKEFFIVSKWFRTEGSPFYDKAKGLWKVVDEEKNADEFLKDEERKTEMRSLIIAMNDLDLSDLARVLGYNPSMNSPTVIRKQVLQRAYTDDKMLADLLRDKKRLAILKIFRRAVAVDIIKHSPVNGYTYNQLTLGFNDSEVAFTLASDEWKERLGAIDRASKMEDPVIKKLSTGAKKTDVTVEAKERIAGEDLIESALNKEIIKREGSYYMLGTEKICQAKKDLIEAYLNEPAFREKLVAALKEFEEKTEGEF